MRVDLEQDLRKDFEQLRSDVIDMMKTLRRMLDKQAAGLYSLEFEHTLAKLEGKRR